MHRDVRALLLVALLAGVGVLSSWGLPWMRGEPQPLPPLAAGQRAAAMAQLEPSRPISEPLCPPGQLPTQGVCVPVPEARPLPTPWLLKADAHVVRRNLDRPAAFHRYRWPVALTPQTRFNGQLAAARAAGVGPAGTTIEVSQGTQVLLPRLAGQLGSATVVYVGSAFGGSLVSVHHVKDHEADVTYWLVIGNISRLAPDLSVGMKLAGDTLLGELGPSNSKSQPDFSLWLDCYRLRAQPAQVDWQRFPENLKTLTEAIPVDPRDVLPFL